MNVVEQVTKELQEMSKLGLRVPAAAYAVAKEEAEELRQNGMRIGDIADHCIELANFK